MVGGKFENKKTPSDSNQYFTIYDYAQISIS